MTIERIFSKTEDLLSTAASVPALGTIPAAFKVAMGLIQALAAVALAILSAIPAYYKNEKAQALFERSCSHIAHGLGNMMAGIVEGIPLVGSILYFIRERYSRLPNTITVGPSTTSKEIRLATGQERKFLAYQCLLREPGIADGCTVVRV